MKLQRAVFSVIAAFAVSVGAHAAAAQSAAVKPPKPVKSDDHGHKTNGSEIAGGKDPDFWVRTVPLVRSEMSEGDLRTVDDKAICREPQRVLLGFLSNSQVMTASAGPEDPSCASRDASAVDAASSRSAALKSLTDAGAPSAEASALLNAMSGILSSPKSGQLRESIDSLNRLIQASPDSFLSSPPAYFLAIHSILSSLLKTGTTI